MSRTPQNRERRWRYKCPVCGRVEDLGGAAIATCKVLLQNGWQWTSQITEGPGWHLVCPKHFKPGSRIIYNDAEKDPQRISLPLDR